MTTTFVLIASGILIGAGIAVIWRDMQRSRRRAFVLQRDVLQAEESAAADAEVEITIQHRKPDDYPGLSSLASLARRASSMRASMPATEPMEPVLVAAPARASLHPLEQLREAASSYEPKTAPPSPTLEEKWAGLQPVLTAGIMQVNAVLETAQLALGPAGETAWSYKNKGYGVYRRLLRGEESLAWVRMELTGEGMLEIGIKSHKPEWSALNGSVTTQAAGLTAVAVSDLLAVSLKPAATHASQLARPAAEIAAPLSESIGADRNEPADKPAQVVVGDGTWHNVDAIVSAALKATNGALAQTGAKLLPLAPAAWDADMRRHRMTLTVEVDAADVARMLIERLPHEIEVAVGVRDVQMIDLGRRRRIPIAGMTTHALAELIASCAWPAIARFKDTRRSA